MPAKKAPSANTAIATVAERAMMSQRPCKYVLAGLGGSGFRLLRIGTCRTFIAIFSSVLYKPYFKHKLHRRHWLVHPFILLDIILPYARLESVTKSTMISRSLRFLTT